MSNKYVDEMRRLDLMARVEALPNVSDDKFLIEFKYLWKKVISEYYCKSVLSERGTFVYFSPYEPVTHNDMIKLSRNMGGYRK